ncbi:hypothetical protein N2E71_07885 [Leuconostoc citreum]
MLGDHIYECFSNQGAPIWLTVLGRAVAPIFLFLSAEGFYYTHSKFFFFMLDSLIYSCF